MAAENSTVGPAEDRWLIRHAELGIDGPIRKSDARLARGVIVEIGSDLPHRDGERVLDAGGGALLPGLADHHLHLMATAAAARSIDLAGGPLPDSRPTAPDSSTTADSAPATQDVSWLRVIGAGVELLRTDVDRVWPERPVRVQHRSGALWTLNTPAVEALSAGLTADERRSGQLWRSDRRLRELLSTAYLAVNDLRALSDDLAGQGISHLTDATPDLDAEAMAELTVRMSQHVLFLGDPRGDGPRKHVVTDHDLPDLAVLAAAIRLDHEVGRPAAVHAVSAVGLEFTLAAFHDAGTIPGDRVEHAAVCSDSAAGRLADLGLVVVTQPSIATRHGVAFRADSDPDDVEHLWRYAGLLRAGVKVAISSDAPYGDANPWSSIRSAVTRRLSDDTELGQRETVPARLALSSMLSHPSDPGGEPRQVGVGAAADLCVLTSSLDSALCRAVSTGAGSVRATFVGGRRVYPPPAP